MRNIFTLNSHILGVINNNIFIKRLFRHGLEKFFITNLHVGVAEKRVCFVLNILDVPHFCIAKYGYWGSDYNVMSFCLSGIFVKCSVSSVIDESKIFSKNVKVKRVDRCYNLVLSGKDWSVEIEDCKFDFNGYYVYFDSDFVDRDRYIYGY